MRALDRMSGKGSHQQGDNNVACHSSFILLNYKLGGFVSHRNMCYFVDWSHSLPVKNDLSLFVKHNAMYEFCSNC
jgi:hypothetical protein